MIRFTLTYHQDTKEWRVTAENKDYAPCKKIDDIPSAVRVMLRGTGNWLLALAQGTAENG